MAAQTLLGVFRHDVNLQNLLVVVNAQGLEV